MPLALLMGRLRWRIETRRGHAVKIFTAWLALMCILHVGAMMWLEGMGLSDALWVTFVTAFTIGYGDVSAKTDAGRTATVVLMGLGTIFVAAALASLLFERAAERRARKIAGKWRWNLKDHLLIVSTTGSETPRYLASLVRQIRGDEHFADRQIAIMTTGFVDGLPETLHTLGCVYLNGDGDSAEEIALACVATANTVVVLGESRQPKADAFVFDVTRRIRDAGFKGRIVAEVADDANRARMCGSQTDSCVRPVRGYPEILARALIAPGAERVIEDLSTIGGAECEAIRIDYTGPWSDLCMAFLNADIGMPIGLRDSSGDIRTAPRAGEIVDADEIYVVTRDARNGLQQRVDALSSTLVTKRAA